MNNEQSWSTVKASPKTIGIGLTLVISLGVAWFYLTRSLFPYFQVVLTRADFRTNQFLILCILLLLFTQNRPKTLPLWPQYNRWPLLTTLFGAICFAITEHLLDINILSTFFFACTSYGLLGLWIPPHKWRANWLMVILFFGSMPILQHIQTFLGYPLRLLTADVVQQALQGMGAASLELDTILLFENGISHIDIPCSGVQALWTGTLLALALTWFEQERLTLRWLGRYVSLLLLLIITNTVRVFLLILIGIVYQLPTIAEWLHVPLGLLGFLLGGMLFLATAPAHRPTPTTPTHNPTHLPVAGGVALTLLFLLLPWLLPPYQRQQTDILQETTTLWPATLPSEPLPLLYEQRAWLLDDGAESAERVRFTYNGVRGTALFVVSKNWHAHHKPERCFLGEGLQLTNTATHLVNPAFPVRHLELLHGEDQQYSGYYWFQSAEQTTDDYATRIWSDLRLDRPKWILVTLLFDQEIAPAHPEINTLLEQLQQQLAYTAFH